MGMVPPRVPRPIHSKAPPWSSPCTQTISWRQSGNDALVISSMAARSVVGALTGSLNSAPGAKNDGKSPSGPRAYSRRFAHDVQSMAVTVACPPSRPGPYGPSGSGARTRSSLRRRVGADGAGGGESDGCTRQ